MQVIGGKAYSSKTTNAFVVKDYYTIDLEESKRSLEFEYSLGDIERKASKSLRKLRERRRIDLKDKARIAEFLLAQWVRGEDFRQLSNSFNNLAFRDMARQSSEKDIRLFHELSFGRLVPDDEWQELWERYTSDNGPGFKNHTSNIFAQFQSLTGELKQTLLLTRLWSVYELAEPMLVSGDRPVVLTESTRTDEYISSPGIAKVEQIIFPISRTMALVLDRPPEGISSKALDENLNSVTRVSASREQGQEINLNTALNAREKLFGHPSDAEELARLAGRVTPISDWSTGVKWDEGTQRLIELKEFVVSNFRGYSRDKLSQVIAEARRNGGEPVPSLHDSSRK